MDKNLQSSFDKALLGDREIKHTLILNQIEKICLKTGLISQLDVFTKSKRHKWLVDVIESHIVSAELLQEVIFKHEDSDNHEELYRSVVRDIAERLLSHQKPFPRQ
ncbi:hypothetical protein NL53_05990 [Vibrio variabilis]|uniref:Uncharacterized protein n=1 Tax=Vibrio variabilis TaxID=990271 RepID=A0ABR4YF18_9VIBR|nr:hypothetical protein NL53_05990 [Vibrio variabilis]